jgi:hypothetical protein
VTTQMPSWTAVPARRLGQRDLNVRIWAVLGALMLAAITGPVALIMAGGDSGVAPVTTYRVDPVARLATQAAVDFLAGRPTSVTAAEGVDVAFGAQRSQVEIGAAAVRSPLAEVAETAVVDRQRLSYLGRSYEVVTIIAVGRDGSRWTVAVPVYIDGPALAAGVTLLPSDVGGVLRAPALNYVEDERRTGTSESVRALVTAWATAYAAGDEVALKQIAGDPQPGRYRGLGGFSVNLTPVIVSAVTVTGDGGSPVQILRVAVWMRPVAALSAQPIAVEFDLLVEQPGTDVPKVVAWGPAGSAPSLVRYGNRTNG